MSDLPRPSGFAELGLRPELTSALADLGYEEPTPIQRAAIPPLLAGSDLLGRAATGTGKTAAFALPLLQGAPAGPRRGPGDGPAGLVLVPTRELCMQVSQAVHRYGRELDVRVLPVYGGQPVGRQLRELGRGVDLVVATPGRALDLLQRGALDLGGVRRVVLDEADEMLDLGFADELDGILAATPADRQTVLFSATMPPRIADIARRHLRDPVNIRIEPERPAPGTAPRVRQQAFVVAREHKPAALARVLDLETPAAAIVFCRTRQDVDTLTETLAGRGYRAEALHGGVTQEQRDRVMGRLRSGAAELVVATDVAARGLDVEQLSHVVNYDVPAAVDSYVHRIGRVGRGGREGVAITLAEPRQQRMLDVVERATGSQIERAAVPTPTDVRARRLAAVRDAVRDRLLGPAGAPDLDDVRAVVADLAARHDPAAVAAAALQLAYEAAAPAESGEHIPDARGERGGRGHRAGGAGSGERTRRGERGAGGRRRDDSRGGGDRRSAARGAPGRAAGTGRVFVSAGRAAGLRPSDLVGAIANETRLAGSDIGAIEVADRFSLVEVPEAAVTEVVHALRRTRVKGRKVQVRRDRAE